MKEFSGITVMSKEKRRKEHSRPVTQENKPQEVVPEVAEPNYWKYVFIGLVVILFACMAFTGTRVGVSGDEFMDDANGKYALAYYADGDTTFVDYSNVKELADKVHMKYYGSGFELWPSFFVRYLHLSDSNYFLFRHLLCSFFGFLLFLFTALIAKRLARSWIAGILALLLCALTPTLFGLSFFATKDIPFAAGFAIANYAFLSIFDHLPKFRVMDILMAIFGIALAVSIRIGGLMLLLYLVVLFLFAIITSPQKRQLWFSTPHRTILWKSLGFGALIAFAGAFAGLCFYPNFFYEGPINHITNALTLVSKFPQRIPMLFEGKMIDSLNLPENYLFKSFLYTIPLYVYGTMLLFFVNIRQEWKKYDRAALLYLLFTVIFPISYIVASKANVYNGWRHESFVFCGAAVLCAIGLYETFLWFRDKKFYRIWKFLCPGLVVLSFLPTFIWMVKNYKYTYAYYNVIAGDPYLQFDMDYLETAQTVLFDWLVENELKEGHDSISVSSKNYNVVDYQKHKQYDNISVSENAFKSYAMSDADYTIISTQFIPKQVIKKFFPPKGTIRTEEINGHPIAALVKRNKLDAEGIKLIESGKTKEGLQKLDSAYQYDPENFGIWFWLGLGYFQNKEFEKSIEFFDKDMNYEFTRTKEKLALIYMYNGSSLYELKRYDEAITTLKKAEQTCVDKGNIPFIKAHLGLSYFYNKNYAEAIPYLQEATSSYPFLTQALNECYANK